MKKILTVLALLIGAVMNAQTLGDVLTWKKGPGLGDAKLYTTPVVSSLYALNGSGTFALLAQSNFANASHNHTASQVTDFNAAGDARWSLLGHTHVAADVTNFVSTGDAQWLRRDQNLFDVSDKPAALSNLGAGGIGAGIFQQTPPAGPRWIRLNSDDSHTLQTASQAIGELLPDQSGNSGRVLSTDGTNPEWIGISGSGTVTSVSVTTANGVSGSVANPTTTPAITLTLGAITPASVAAIGAVSGSNLSGTNTGDQSSIVGITGTTAQFNAALTGADFATGGGTATGTNTGDQTSVSGNAGTATALATGRTIAITGDLAYTSPSFDGSANVTAAGTLATVNGNVGTFGSATQSNTITVNGKGLVTAISAQTVTPAVSSITGLGSGVASWLADATSAKLASAVTDETGSGALVFGTSPTFVTPALGTPSSGTLTNCTFPTLNQSTTGSAATITTGRTFRTDLASTSTATFDGGANVTPGVTGTLAVANGGTGSTTASGALTNLGMKKASVTNFTFNSATYTDLTGATVTLTASTNYVVRAIVNYTTPSAITGMGLSVTMTGSPTSRGMNRFQPVASTGTVAGQIAADDAGGIGSTSTGTTELTATLDGIVLTSGSTSTVQLRVARGGTSNTITILSATIIAIPVP